MAKVKLDDGLFERAQRAARLIPGLAKREASEERKERARAGICRRR